MTQGLALAFEISSLLAVAVLLLCGIVTTWLFSGERRVLQTPYCALALLLAVMAPAVSAILSIVGVGLSLGEAELAVRLSLGSAHIQGAVVSLALIAIAWTLLSSTYAPMTALGLVARSIYKLYQDRELYVKEDIVPPWPPAGSG